MGSDRVIQEGFPEEVAFLSKDLHDQEEPTWRRAFRAEGA